MDGAAEFLFHLGDVPVSGGLVGPHVPASFGWCEPSLTALPPSEDPHLASATTGRESVDHSVLEKRPQPQDGGRGIAAGAADVPGFFHFLAVEFHVAVDELREFFRLGVLHVRTTFDRRKGP